MKWKEDLFKYFPSRICGALSEAEIASDINEIRFRVNRKIQLVYQKNEELLDYTVSEHDCRQLFELLCEHSVYAMSEELKQCFVVLPRGYRVGVTGTHCIKDGRIGSLTAAHFFNYRIARECKGFAQDAIPYITQDNKLNSTLIISAPCCGKTTLLRDAARLLSSGKNGKKVCIADERSEIAGGKGGVPFLDVGDRSDVMDGCPKAEAIVKMVRTMSPDVIITDEIGTSDDAEAIKTAANCGVCVIASAHASHVEELRERKELAELIDSHTFKHILLLFKVNEKIFLKKVA